MLEEAGKEKAKEGVFYCENIVTCNFLAQAVDLESF
jgi:hypothetical protein